MQNFEPIHQKPLGLGKTLVMSILPILMCLSVFMSVFTPYPIALSSVIYGRAKGVLIFAISIAVCLIFLNFSLVNISVLVFLVLSGLFSFLLSETVLRNFDPIKSVLSVGLLVSLIILLVSFISVKLEDKSLLDSMIVGIEKLAPEFEKKISEMEKMGVENTFELKSKFSNPTFLANEFLSSFPGYLIMGVFLMLWANLFLLLKSYRVFNKDKNMTYSEKNLLDIKMPEQLIWPVILSFAIVLFAPEHSWYYILGLTALKGLGVFYFFQGFGIYIAFLDYARITGLLRSILVFITVLSAAQLLAVVGVVDMFINFKKLMKKKD